MKLDCFLHLLINLKQYENTFFDFERDEYNEKISILVIPTCAVVRFVSGGSEIAFKISRRY